MADYPDNVYDQRTLENVSGVEYDPTRTTRIYAEDLVGLGDEVTAIEETLGTTPQGIYATVKAWLEALEARASAEWGQITGTLSDQTDLQSALNAKQNSLGFTPEDVANKQTNLTASATKYPTVNAVNTGLATKQDSLGFTAENSANKSTSVSTDQASNTKYPSVKAVYDWAVATFQAALGFTPENVANKSTTTTLGSSDTLYPSQKAVKTYVDNQIAGVGGLPTGTMAIWPTATPPTGFEICNGASLLRAGTYAALFAVIGTTYGSADGTHFNLPDLQARVPVGYKSGDADFGTLGQTGGEKTHTLTSAEMPSHHHQQQTNNSGGGFNGAFTSTGATSNGFQDMAGSSAPHVITADTGGGGAHNNIQPYIALNYIIKI